MGFGGFEELKLRDTDTRSITYNRRNTVVHLNNTKFWQNRIEVFLIDYQVFMLIKILKRKDMIRIYE